MRIVPRLLALSLLISALPIQAALAPHRTQISLNLSSRLPEGTPRKEEAFFDQKARLKVKVVSPTESTPNVQLQWMLLYDDVATNGRIKREQFSDVITVNLGKGEEKALESGELRLTGKINKKGQLIGMRYEGYGVRLYEGGKLVFESYQPSVLKNEKMQMVPVLVSMSSSQTGEPTPPRPAIQQVHKETITSPAITHQNEAKSLAHKTSESGRFSRAPVEGSPLLIPDPQGSVTLFEMAFSRKEVDAILKVVNELAEGELVSRVGLDIRAARNLVKKRPFQTIEELPQVSYVKKDAMTYLKRFVNRK